MLCPKEDLNKKKSCWLGCCVAGALGAPRRQSRQKKGTSMALSRYVVVGEMFPRGKVGTVISQQHDPVRLGADGGVCRRVGVERDLLLIGIGGGCALAAYAAAAVKNMHRLRA
jgi:hypothetical protein